MKNLKTINLLAISLFSLSVFALENIAVIDMRTAVLSTQAADNALKALEEDATYAANLEDAQTLQAERQAIADNIVGDVKSFAADTLRRIPIPIPFTNKNIYDDIGAVRDFVEEQAQKLRGYILNELERFIG